MSKASLEEAEARAAHAAMKVYAETLQRELDALGEGGDVLHRLGAKRHYLLLADTSSRYGCILRFEVGFRSRPSEPPPPPDGA